MRMRTEYYGYDGTQKRWTAQERKEMTNPRSCGGSHYHPQVRSNSHHNPPQSACPLEAF
jgi:hypothetical protein